MSCSSIKNRFEELKSKGEIDFAEVMHMYTDLQGSLDAHKMELEEIKKVGEGQRINHLQQHINDGEQLLSEIKSMTLH